MAVSFLLDVTAIPGESVDPNSAYNQKIEIDGWSFGASQAGVMQAGSGRATGKVSVQDFTFTKHADKSSPKLMETCATGDHVQQATLIARRTGQTGGGLTPYLNVIFTDLIVSSYQTSGSNGDSGLPAGAHLIQLHQDPVSIHAAGSGQVSGYSVSVLRSEDQSEPVGRAFRDFEQFAVNRAGSDARVRIGSGL